MKTRLDITMAFVTCPEPVQFPTDHYRAYPIASTMTEMEFTTYLYRSIKTRLIQAERMRQKYIATTGRGL